jgi:hypothetical protein
MCEEYRIMYDAFYLFSAFFETGKKADEFISEQWESEPEDVSDEEYEEWENNNPTWKLKEELEFFMDSDFIEPAQDIEYIKSMIKDDGEKFYFVNNIPSGHNHFVIIGINGIWGDRRKPNSNTPIRNPENTKTLNYLGKYNEGT